MNICITGALGHIGSALLKSFDNSQIKTIHLVDNMNKQRYCSLFNLPDKYNYIFHEMDILSSDIEQIIKDSDIVVHLAAISDAESSIRELKEVNRINRKGLKYIADLCAKYHVSLIFPSTTSVYGSSVTLTDENCSDKQLLPQTPYADSKLFGERYLRQLGEKKGLHFLIFRFGTIFGHSIGMRFNTAVNKFGFQAATDQNITVWKTALKQVRPYCDLIDCINAINYVINNNIFNNEIYNIITINLTVKNIIDAIRKFIPRAKISYVDSPIMNTLSYAVSNKKSLNKGFSYHGNLDKSLLSYFKILKNVNSKVIKLNI